MIWQFELVEKDEKVFDIAVKIPPAALLYVTSKSQGYIKIYLHYCGTSLPDVFILPVAIV